MIRIRYTIFYLYLILIPLLVVIAAGVWIHRELTMPFRNYPGSGRFVTIERGSSKVVIANKLAQEGIISNKVPFLIYLSLGKKRETLKAGEYYFDAPVSQLEVIDKLVKGKVYHIAVTIPEGLTIHEIADLIASDGLATRESLLREMYNTDSIRDMDDKATTLEGYLFPDTYWFVRRATSGEIISRLVKRFQEVFNAAYRKRSEELGLGVRGVLTLASLIEKETGNDAERPLVAAVFLNRLQEGIPLQCDPTVIYALQRQNKFAGVLDKEALRIDSPYNTYRYMGLPPGPIANPGRKSIEAALYPADVNFLFFVSKNDGTHSFSRTLQEHNAAVQLYQRGNGGTE